MPDGSLAILNLTLEGETSKDKLNELLRNAALNGDLVEQICYHTSNELVSSDIIGNSCPSVFDSQATLVHSDKKTAVIYAGTTMSSDTRNRSCVCRNTSHRFGENPIIEALKGQL